jgi:hypothetical protein
MTIADIAEAWRALSSAEKHEALRRLDGLPPRDLIRRTNLDAFTLALNKEWARAEGEHR